MSQTMKLNYSRFLLLALCATVCFVATPARASLVSFSPTPSDLYDLDHHYSYSWRLDNINLNNVTITSASITFTNIANWDSNPNMLFVYLMDTAVGSGVRSLQDHDLSEAPVGNIVDHFASGFNSPSLVLSSTGKQKLFQHSFTTTPTTFTYTFTAAQLTLLMNYINNGHDVAFGFDSECHFFNDGITFTMNVVPIPEVASLLPVGLLVAIATAFEIRRRRRANG
jgi:hypothetical protein